MEKITDAELMEIQVRKFRKLFFVLIENGKVKEEREVSRGDDRMIEICRSMGMILNQNKK